MTGYGQGECTVDGVRFVVELRSVNHRYLEMMVRMPTGWISLEEQVKKTIRSAIKRGRIDVFITKEGEGITRRRLGIDWDVAGSVIQAAEELKTTYQVEGTVTIPDLLAMPDVLKAEEVRWDLDQIRPALIKAVEGACSSLVCMRQREGEALFVDLLQHLEKLKKLVAEIGKRAPVVVTEYRDRLHKRLLEFLDEASLEEDRLLAEAAIFADRSDIQEELIRLSSHIDQFHSVLYREEPVGRRLDFLLQEMNREINTIGSKGNDAQITSKVVDFKSELEKMREQVQNIE